MFAIHRYPEVPLYCDAVLEVFLVYTLIFLTLGSCLVASLMASNNMLTLVLFHIVCCCKVVALHRCGLVIQRYSDVVLGGFLMYRLLFLTLEF